MFIPKFRFPNWDTESHGNRGLILGIISSSFYPVFNAVKFRIIGSFFVKVDKEY